MKYIKLYENYNFNDEDVEHILTDYYHDDKCEIIKNDYYTLYQFDNINYYNEAIKELDRHELEYKKVLINNEDGYIITKLSKEIIDFLDEKLLSLKTKENDKYVYYLNNIDDRSTKIYYNKKSKIFFIDYDEIWSILRSKFNSDYDTQDITTWYVVTNLQKECIYTNIKGCKIAIEL